MKMKRTTMDAYQIGDAVWYRGSWGSDPRKPGIIVGRGRKNGSVVYDVQLIGERDPINRDRWGYPDQFTPRFTL